MLQHLESLSDESAHKIQARATLLYCKAHLQATYQIEGVAETIEKMEKIHSEHPDDYLIVRLHIKTLLIYACNIEEALGEIEICVCKEYLEKAR
mmetsp:Transcript_40157/g.52628  ORF Transcript_40157/g.52628 Transcript_40157/m.52628 type:complete len:94 (+) Transcript_40157:183-464(+)